MTCPWCDKPFEPRKKGQRFCCPRHKAQWHTAMKALGEAVWRTGFISRDALHGLVSAVDGSQKGEEAA